MDRRLKKHILENIKAEYKKFDKGHNIAHFNFVTKNCVNYAKQLNESGNDVDLDIAFVVGAYHDIGMKIAREGHALSSGKLVRQDEVLKQFYSAEQIEIIAQAVEDHSSHLEYEPRSIYGKIVADADRNNTKYLVFSRPLKFGIKNNKNLTKKEHIDEAYEFVKKKFGREGYVRYWLNITDTTKEQKEIWELLDNEQLCKAYLEGLFDEISKGRFKK